jgi:hypothetical protein
MDARALLNDGSGWTAKTTRAAMPLLLRCAIDGEPITYGKLRDATDARVLPIAYRYVAGRVGDVCAQLGADLGKPVPPLNAIIVNDGSGLPSHGVDSYVARFLGKRLGSLGATDREAYARQAMDAVFSYGGWRGLAARMGIRLPEGRTDRPSRGGRIPPPNPRQFSSGPESAEHQALKHWVAERPQLFRGYGSFARGRTEQMLSSGDRLDVLFVNAQMRLAVEVKTRGAPAAEIQRGIYQCVKYRATLRAMQLAAAQAPNANAVLVIDGNPPAIVSDLAARLSVDMTVVETTVVVSASRRRRS